MQATALKSTQRKPGEHARARAIIRFNGLMFHSLAAASFLETAVPLHGEFVQRMAQMIERCAETGRIERILFRPWLALERPAPMAPPAQSARAARLAPLALQPAW